MKGDEVLLKFKEHLNKQRVYYKWGLLELQRRIEDRCESGYDEYEVINEFIHEMEHYAGFGKVNSFMFSCAADAGRQVLDDNLTHYI